jgi:hypothetical protein
MCILTIVFSIFIGGLLWMIIISPKPIEAHLVIIVGMSLCLIISLWQVFLNAVLWTLSIRYYKFHEDFMIASTSMQEHLIAIKYSNWKAANRYWIRKAHKDNFN